MAWSCAMGMGCWVSASTPLLGLPHLHPSPLSYCCFWVSSTFRGEAGRKEAKVSYVTVVIWPHQLSICKQPSTGCNLGWIMAFPRKPLCCMIPDVALARPVDVLCNSLICCPYWYTPKLPNTRVFSSLCPADFWGEFHQDVSSQVTFFSAHLACDKLTHPPTSSGKCAVSSIASSLFTLTLGYSRQEEDFCIYIWELPVSKGYMEICSMNTDTKLNLGPIGEPCPI